MNIIIIKHPESDRVGALSSELKSKRLKPIILKGVLVRYERQKILRQFKVKDTGLPNGDLGCTLAHIKAWEYALGKGFDKVLILEDDAYPSKADWLAELQTAYDQCGSNWNFSFIQTKRGVASHAYIVTRAGIEALLGAKKLLTANTGMNFDLAIWGYRVPRLIVCTAQPIFKTIGEHDYQGTSLRLKENGLVNQTQGDL